MPPPVPERALLLGFVGLRVNPRTRRAGVNHRLICCAYKTMEVPSTKMRYQVASLCSPLRFAIVSSTSKPRLPRPFLVPQPIQTIALPPFSTPSRAAHGYLLPYGTSRHGLRPTVCAIPPNLYRSRQQGPRRSLRRAPWSL